MEINYKKLRSDLKDSYGTATLEGFPVAMFEISVIEKGEGKNLFVLLQNWELT